MQYSTLLQDWISSIPPYRFVCSNIKCRKGEIKLIIFLNIAHSAPILAVNSLYFHSIFWLNSITHSDDSSVTAVLQFGSQFWVTWSDHIVTSFLGLFEDDWNKQKNYKTCLNVALMGWPQNVGLQFCTSLPCLLTGYKIRNMLQTFYSSQPSWFSQRWLWRILSPGINCRVVRWNSTEVSPPQKQHIASNLIGLEDVLRNFCWLSTAYTALYPRICNFSNHHSSHDTSYATAYNKCTKFPI
jgi:hypothetical protein